MQKRPEMNKCQKEAGDGPYYKQIPEATLESKIASNPFYLKSKKSYSLNEKSENISFFTIIFLALKFEF